MYTHFKYSSSRARKAVYAYWIEKWVPRLLSFQDAEDNSETLGCFFYPYWKNSLNYANCRWQEAVLSLAWLQRRRIGTVTSTELIHRIEAGIDFWCKSQHSDGSFPEYTTNERSFSATAFSTLAIAEAMTLVGMKNKWVRPLERSGNWLCKNNEVYLTNQESAASVALLNLHALLHHKSFFEESLRKMNIVLGNQSDEGFFYENNKMDLSYSSLTLEMLGKFNENIRSQRVSEAAKKLILLTKEFIYPDGTFGGTYNSRSLGWLILDGFEMFSRIPESSWILSKLFDSYGKEKTNIAHIPDDRHLCTDLYRLCWAHDHCGDLQGNDDGNVRINPESMTFGDISINKRKNYICISNTKKNVLYSLWSHSGLKIFTDVTDRKIGISLLSRIFGPFGTHRFQKFKYFFVGGKYSLSGLKTGRGDLYSFLDDLILVSTNRKSFKTTLVKGRNFKKEAPDEIHIEYPEEKVIVTSYGGEITCTDLGRKSFNDSLFYGDRSAEFLKIELTSKNGAKQLQYTIRVLMNEGTIHGVAKSIDRSNN